MEIVLIDRCWVDAVLPESEIEVTLRGGLENCEVRLSRCDDIESRPSLLCEPLFLRNDPKGDANAL